MNKLFALTALGSILVSFAFGAGAFQHRGRYYRNHHYRHHYYRHHHRSHALIHIKL